ncbi:MAG: hypothetical protein ACKO1J_15065, partial [Tagaea sp.]
AVALPVGLRRAPALSRPSPIEPLSASSRSARIARAGTRHKWLNLVGKGSRLCFGPLAALAALTALSVWAAASQLPPSRADDPLLSGVYSLNFGREIVLQPMRNHPDEAIIEAFLRRRDEKSPFIDWSNDDLERIDRRDIYTSRLQIEP